MVKVPVRLAPVLASKVNVARPLPVPPELVCSQEALAVAVHVPAIVTTSASLPAAGPSTKAYVAKCASMTLASSGSKEMRFRVRALRASRWALLRRRARTNRRPAKTRNHDREF